MTASQQDTTSASALATFGGGCFWCTEAVFADLKGVIRVTSGYSGGAVERPTYRQVCEGNTGHAEVIQVTYDPQQISYEKLLEVFFATHDPTTLNRQGHDVGTQYRSVIFTHTAEQQRIAEEVIAQLNTSDAYESAVVTKVEPLRNFFPAEDYHQEYYSQHGQEPYCQMVIQPKLEKFRKVFHGELRNS